MRFAKSFLAAFVVALFAFAATPVQVPADDSSIIWVDNDGNVEEIWLIYIGGELDTI